MPPGSTVEERRVEKLVGSMRRALRTERERTELERDAFEAFAARITGIQPSSSTPAVDSEPGSPHGVNEAVALQSTPVLNPSTSEKHLAIRNAYEETVMSVPFYEAEYGDTYEESLHGEFGPGVATAMTQPGGFSPFAKQVLLGKIKQARTDRVALLETCDRERDSVDDVAAVLKPTVEGLRAIESMSSDDTGFDALVSHREELQTLENKCEQTAAMRQATIHRHRPTQNLRVDAPDICVYLYSEFESSYPLLSLCTHLSQRIENARQHIDHALSTSP